MTIVLRDTPATKLDLLVEQAQDRKASNDRYTPTGPPFRYTEAKDALWALATFQPDENARRLFMGLYQALTATHDE